MKRDQLETKNPRKKFLFFRRAGLFLVTFVSLTYILATLSQIGGWLLARHQLGSKAAGPLAAYESPVIKFMGDYFVDEAKAFFMGCGTR